MYIFEGPRGMPCGILGNTNIYECGRPRLIGVTQWSLASPIYASKYVIGAFGLMRKATYFHTCTCLGSSYGVEDL